MPTGRMYENFTGPWSLNQIGAAHNYGMAFTPQSNGFISTVRWYRGASGTGYVPGRLQLWNAGTQALLWETQFPVDGGSAGWHDTTVSPNVAVTAGTTYVATAYLPTNSWHSYIAGASVPSYGTGLNKPASFRRYIASSTGYPATADSAYGEEVDVTFSTENNDTTTDQPVTSLALENKLEAWFSSGADNTHTGELPWQTKLTADNIWTEIQTRWPQLDALMGTVSSNTSGTLMGRLALLLPLADAATGVLANLQTVLTNLGATDSDVGANGLAIAGVGQKVDTARNREAYSLGAVGWTMTDQQVFQDTFTWDEPADRYVLTATAWDASRVFNTYQGHAFFTRPYWWCPLDGMLVEGYQTFMSRSTVLRRPGQALKGVLVVGDPDIEWTIQAWTYTG